jgi:processive 1,2-diacylglycerol beta-glucosyltransferase
VSVPADRPRILVVALSFGSGHVRAAAAVARKLRDRSSDADVVVVDALDHAAWWFRILYVWPYWLMLRLAPSLWRRLFESRRAGRTKHTAPEWLFRFGCSRLLALVAEFKPSVVVAAEVAACELAVIARRRKLTAASIVNVITDHEAEPAWVAPEIDLHCVPSSAVRTQLVNYGAHPDRIVVSGIPIDDAFAIQDESTWSGSATTPDARLPLILLMAGGEGPSRMDEIAERLCRSGYPMELIAIAGRDASMQRRLARVPALPPVSVTMRGWVDDVPALMRRAALLVTKPGGMTTSEAAACGVPCVLFDPIPGPEEQNAERLVDSGAAVLTHGTDETAAAVIDLLERSGKRRVMADTARRLAMPSAADTIAALVLQRAARSDDGVVLILSIRNGAGHTAVAEAIAEALRAPNGPAAEVVDVADYMSPLLYATHVTLFLWLVKRLPGVWAWIDRYQKSQSHTSPDWHYRRGCRRLFDAVRSRRIAALVATEVGCCEIGSLLKRDLGLECPLVAVNGEYDADRAWVQPEVDVWSVADERVRAEMCRHGAPGGRVHAWGVPLDRRFARAAASRTRVRVEVCEMLGLKAELPIVLVSAGSEGLGRLDRVAARLLTLPGSLQVVVLAGRNPVVRRRCEALVQAGGSSRLRVLGWTRDVPRLMAAADLLVSKLGHTFDEAVAAGLPIVALEPPPGSEQVQYRLLDAAGVGRAVRGVEQMAAMVGHLLNHEDELAAMRLAAARWHRGGAATAIATWIHEATRRGDSLRPAVAGNAVTPGLVAAGERS